MTPTTSTIIPMVQTMAIFAMNPIKIGFLRLEVVFPAADGVTDHPEHCQDDADHQHNNSDGPDDGNLRDEPDQDRFSEARSSVSGRRRRDRPSRALPR